MVKLVKTKAELDLAKADAAGKLLIIDFYATWCGPCKIIAPTIEKMEQEYTDCVFIKIDVDENEEASQAEEISAMPTFKFYKNGEQVDMVVGASEEKIRQTIQKLR